MKSIKNLFKVNISTYFLILTFLFTGLIKNIILIYLIVIVHELGHIFIVKLLKYKIIKVDIYPMGGVTTINKKINTSIKHEILISIFGIVFQIILGFIFLIMFKFSYISSNTYVLFINYNKTIMLFNMLPIIPLDGYIFFRSIWELILPYKKAFYLSFIVSITFIFLFITYNEIYSLNNYLVISFLIYKIITTFKDFKYEYFRFLMERHLYDLKYSKVKYHNDIDLKLLKKDTYHYFKDNNKIYSEKKLLAKKFNN
ncbi:MAG: hypothetical protein E7163_00390 [Firmicutes bacterium]|nr:hypothetical protein [Bacillota bacterium]